MAQRTYKYYDLIMAAFVTVLLCSDVIGAAKIVRVWGFTFGAGILFFPISYIFGDILTEVYGYARARKVVWAGFAALAFASGMSWVIVHLPPDPGWPNQGAYAVAFGSTIVFDEPSGAACMPGGVWPCGLSAGAPPLVVLSGPVSPCGCFCPCSFGSTVRPVL